MTHQGLGPPSGPRSAASPLFIAGLLLFVAALVTRIAFIVDSSDSPFLAHRLIDEQDYDGLARGLLQGRWPGDEAIFRPPLYPAFLAAVYRLCGDDPLTVRLVQVGLGALAAPLTTWIAARALGSLRQAIAAGAIVALCGPLIYYDAQLLAASLDVLLVLGVVALLLHADATQRVGWWALAGTALGLSATNRGSMLLVVPVVVGWAFARREASVSRPALARRLGAFAAAAALVIAPLAWHNARNDERPETSYAAKPGPSPTAVASVPATLARIVTGRYCPLGWADGANLYIGNQPGLVDVNRDAHVAHFDWFNKLITDPWAHGASTAYEHSRWFKGATRDAIAANPARWLGLMLHKMLEVVNGYEVPRGTSPYAEREYSGLLGLLLWDWPLRFPSGLLLPLGLAGAVAARRDRRSLLLGLVMATQLGFVVAFFVTSRYRLPALPLAAILATGLVARGIERLRSAEARTAQKLAGVVAVAALIVVSNLRLEGQSFRRSAIEHYDLADALTREGKGDAAIEHVRAAIAAAPQFSDAHAYLGFLYKESGRIDAAIEELHVALRLAPDSAVAQQNLGGALLVKGDVAGAEAAFRAAVAQEPRSALACFGLGFALATKGDRRAALPWLEEARRLGYADPRLGAMIEDAARRAPPD